MIQNEMARRASRLKNLAQSAGTIAHFDPVVVINEFVLMLTVRGNAQGNK
jgi:hypothetical protein